MLEGDEYDSAFFDKAPKFLHYHPDEVVITSLEFDHADIYADLAAIELACDCAHKAALGVRPALTRGPRGAATTNLRGLITGVIVVEQFVLSDAQRAGYVRDIAENGDCTGFLQGEGDDRIEWHQRA